MPDNPLPEDATPIVWIADTWEGNTSSLFELDDQTAGVITYIGGWWFDFSYGGVQTLTVNEDGVWAAATPEEFLWPYAIRDHVWIPLDVQATLVWSAESTDPSDNGAIIICGYQYVPQYTE